MSHSHLILNCYGSNNYRSIIRLNLQEVYEKWIFNSDNCESWWCSCFILDSWGHFIQGKFTYIIVGTKLLLQDIHLQNLSLTTTSWSRFRCGTRRSSWSGKIGRSIWENRRHRTLLQNWSEWLVRNCRFLFQPTGICICPTRHEISWMEIKRTNFGMFCRPEILTRIRFNPFLTEISILQGISVKCYVIWCIIWSISTFTSKCRTLINHVGSTNN